jgi:hypothetical protein
LTNKVIWIASYPRSGNTWLRFLVANLLVGSITKSEEIEQIVPDSHNIYREKQICQIGEAIFLKTHWKSDVAISKKVESVGAIYIVRNPLDVIASHINYARIADDVIKNNFIEEFITFGGFQRYVKFQMGTWVENVESWVFSELNFPFLMLKYEDMKTNIYDAVIKMCNFLRLKKTQEEINKAIELSSFKSLLKIEEEEISKDIPGFFKREHEVTNNPEYRFMRKGEVGRFKKVMTTQQIERTLNRFAPIMKKLAYKIESFEY